MANLNISDVTILSLYINPTKYLAIVIKFYKYSMPSFTMNLTTKNLLPAPL